MTLALIWLLLLSTMPTVESARTHIVRLDRNRFIPAEMRVSRGDTLRFVNGEGGPHNVEFLKDSIAADARALIEGAMGRNKVGPMSGPLLILSEESWTFIVPHLPAGRYPLLCSPHWGNMRGAMIVQTP